MGLNTATEAETLYDHLVEIRRQIHKNPEQGFLEFETTKLIKAELDRIGIPYESEIARTGIVATIKGTGEGKSLLMRADMDALPLIEDTDFEFKSQNEGIFHACGHDTHITCLLGAAEILNNNKDQFKGEVNLVFQPAEEGSREYDPTGKIGGGAKPMVMEAPHIFGTADDKKFDGVLALHIVSGSEDASYQVGKIGVGDGPFTGSADEFIITIKGKGGHASAPHAAVDPVYIASQAYVAVQGFLTRVVDPTEPVVFTIGKINGGFRQNIISETCKMEGTLRTLNTEVRTMLKEKIPEVVKSVARAFGGDAETIIYTGYPVGYNDKEINDHVRAAAAELYGDDCIVEVGAQLGAEDFYEFGFDNSIPIAMFWLGGGNIEKGWVGHNHSNYFAIDEEALKIGTSILSKAAINFLNA